MEYERTQSGPSEWRVEAIDYDNEGVVYVAIFTGPQADQRAAEYAEWKNSAKTQPQHQSQKRKFAAVSG